MTDDLLLSSYLFCRHLEQNGMYDYKMANSGHNYPEEETGLLRNCREIHKVFTRSGASMALNADRMHETNLLELLEDNDIVWREGNDIALATGYWRYDLVDLFGDLPLLFHEGYYSVDEKYVPNIK